MGAWADVIKVLRSAIFKNELKNGNYSVKHANKADELGNLGNTTDNVARHVWFSDSEKSGLPRKDDDFKYNPITNTLQVNNLVNTEESSLLPTILLGNTFILTFGQTFDTGITVPTGKTLSDLYEASIFLYENNIYPQWVLTGKVMTVQSDTILAYSGVVSQKATATSIATSYCGMAMLTVVDGKVHINIFNETAVLNTEKDGKVDTTEIVKRTSGGSSSDVPFYSRKSQVQLYFK